MEDNDRETNGLKPEQEELKDTEPGQEPTKKTEDKDMSKENKEEGKEGGGSCCGGNK